MIHEAIQGLHFLVLGCFYTERAVETHVDHDRRAFSTMIKGIVILCRGVAILLSRLRTA